MLLIRSKRVFENDRLHAKWNFVLDFSLYTEFQMTIEIPLRSFQPNGREKTPTDPNRAVL